MYRASYAGSKYYVSDPVNTMTLNTVGTFNLLNHIVKSIVRPFHTYGPGFALDDGRVFTDFPADVIKKRDLVNRGDGKAKHFFYCISDQTLGFLTALFEGLNKEAYDIEDPTSEISIKNLATLISNLFPELKIKIRFEKSEYKKNISSSLVRVLPSIKKIKKIAWKPTTDLKKKDLLKLLTVLFYKIK